MGFVTMGIFTFTHHGIQGAIFQMLRHGLISAALFLCVGVVYDRMHTRSINAYGGIVKNMPKYAVFFLILTMANIGLPGTSGFVGEFLTLLGVFKVNTYIAFFATTGVVLSAVYALFLYKRVFFGTLQGAETKTMNDLSYREFYLLLPLVILIIFFGIYPAVLIDVSAVSVENLINNYNNALLIKG
jgi:NADH-quinone oxidoreductase subunit M